MNTLQPCGPSSACSLIDKSPTLPIVSFEIFIILAAILGFLILLRVKKEKLLQRFFLVAIGTFIFEAFTAPMWDNSHLGAWAYVYSDVSWILTVGWSTLILSTIILVDKFFSKWREWQRFGLYLFVLTIVGYIAEAVVVGIGIRTYSPEVLKSISGFYFLGPPIEALYYIPVFMSLVIGFYKYWSFNMDNVPVVPVKKEPWLRNLVIAVISVFLFEVMVEPMVVNAKLPAWSYVFHDISFLLTGLWVLIIWWATNFVDIVFIQFNLVKRFVLYILFATLFMLPIETFFIISGVRQYGPSATANFSGFTTIIGNIPIEVAFAMPFYLALIISLIRYWEIVFDNKQ